MTHTNRVCDIFTASRHCISTVGPISTTRCRDAAKTARSRATHSAQSGRDSRDLQSPSCRLSGRWARRVGPRESFGRCAQRPCDVLVFDTAHLTGDHPRSAVPRRLAVCLRDLCRPDLDRPITLAGRSARGWADSRFGLRSASQLNLMRPWQESRSGWCFALLPAGCVLARCGGVRCGRRRAPVHRRLARQV